LANKFSYEIKDDNKMLNKKNYRDFAQFHSHRIRRKIFHYAISRLCFFLTALAISQAAVLYAQNEGQDTSTASLVAMLDTKISTAAKYAQTASEAPASVTVITAEEILDYGYQNLAEALGSVRGLYVSYDRTYNYIGTRGFGRPSDYNNRILLLLNGHTLNENVFGSAPFGTDFVMDMSGVERIEIVRGPGSVLYGSGAVFAVVNVITKKGNSIDGVNAAIENGSYGQYQGSLIFGKELKSGFDMVIATTGSAAKGHDLYYPEYDDPSTNNGIAHNLDQDNRYGIFTNLSFRNFAFQGYSSSREKGIPTGSWDVNFNAKPSKVLDQWNHLDLKFDSSIASNLNLFARAYYDHYYYKAWYPYELLQLEDTYGDWAGGELQFRWDFRLDNTLTIGAEYQNHIKASYENWDSDTVLIKINYPTDIASVYVQDEYQVTDNLSITLGVRHENYDGNINSTTPRGAVVYHPAKSSTLKLLYGEAFRRPSLMEANFNNVLWGDGLTNYLLPEKNQTSELVWEQRLNNQLVGIISLYNYRIKNLIEQTQISSDSATSYLNLASVRANGLELELDANLANGFAGGVNYAYQTTKNSLTNHQLSNSPNHLFKTNLSYSVRNCYHIGGEFIYESKRLTESGTSTKPFFLTNLIIRYSPKFAAYSYFEPLGKKLDLSFQIRNLFNKFYELPVGLEYRQVSLPQDGRNYRVALGLKL
jgi:outer membrane receptor for ferrienterochelin and colicins